MGRCRLCGHEGWHVRVNGNGLCRSCGTSVRENVSARMVRVKEALVYVRCTREPVSLLSRCDEAIREVSELVPLEKEGVADIRPSPSSLLVMLETKRAEVAAELQAAESARTRRDMDFRGALPPSESVGTREVKGAAAALEDQESADAASAGERQDQWWAWDTRADDGKDQGAATGAGGAVGVPRSHRERLHCLVLLDPGGIRATLENISMGGLFLSTPRVRPPGSRVRVVLNTPEGPVQAEGVVRWSRTDAGARSPESLPGMGIEFTNSPRILAEFLASRFPSFRLGTVTVST